MDNILEKLYYGKIAPWEKTEDSSAESKSLTDAALQCSDTLLSSLTPEQKALFEKYMSISSWLYCISEYEGFACGFRLGVRLMAAAMENPS